MLIWVGPNSNLVRLMKSTASEPGFTFFLPGYKIKEKEHDAVKAGNAEHLISKPKLKGISTEDINLNDSFSSMKERQLPESHL